MFLNEIAKKNMHERLDGYNSTTKTFEPNSFQGRIDPTDRFLSIYNRPTRKRQLFTEPHTPLPQSNVFKHQTTGDIYILGQTRQDTRYDVLDGQPYVSISMLHLVTPNALGSSGKAIQVRKETQGPPENPGWMVAVDLGETYLDIEFRTSSSEAGVHDSKIENFYAWTPINVIAEQWDFFELNGIQYRVVDTFTDIGMRGLRLDRESDPRVDVVIQVQDRTYNDTTHEWESVTQDFNVTAIVPEATNLASWVDTSASSQIVLAIDHKNIGFTPKINQSILYQGVKRLIKKVSTQAGEKQFQVTCE